MPYQGFIAVGAGAALGAWLRWWLGLRLNTLGSAVPLGTLSANLIGGYVIGLCLGAIAASDALSPQARLFLITGFCGGLTTFSTFSAETLELFLRGQIGWGLGAIGLHVAGSLAATALGLLSIHLLRLGA